MAYSTANFIAITIKYLSFSDNSEEDVRQLLAYPEFTERLI
jgi:predicted phosphoribosyltransferase